MSRADHQIRHAPLVAEAVRLAIAAGWTVDAISDRGTHYLSHAGHTALRIGDHKRFERSRAKRRRRVSINVAQHGWESHLRAVLGRAIAG